MVTYSQIVELIIQREMGIIGKQKLMEVLADAGLDVDQSGAVKTNNVNIGHVERLMTKLNEKYGLVTIMGCKIAVGRKAREGNLALPAILR
ncbi:MAG: hypothetical protein HZB29_11155 [Nitrospinae bacterium]|nr:hypothetical protein [Nitrospinota bacterium]